MKQALGLVEISGLSTAVVVADTMVKAANVRILEIENTKGLGYMTVKVVGDVGAVNAAVNAGKQIGTANGKLVSWKVIPRPSDYVDQTFCCPDPPVPPSPPKKEAQEETEAEAEVEAKAETAAEAPAGELGESEETEANATEPEQETEAEPAENAAEPAEAKTEPKIEAELTEAETTEPAEQEVPDSPETPPEKPKKTAKRTTAEKSTGTTRRKKN